MPKGTFNGLILGILQENTVTLGVFFIFFFFLAADTGGQRLWPRSFHQGRAFGVAVLLAEAMFPLHNPI